MRRVRIFLEGPKDVYFLHEWILNTYASQFNRASNPIAATISKLQLGAVSIKRFVATTLMFMTTKNYYDVLHEVSEWAERANCYYVIAQILPNEDGKKFYYMMKGNVPLQNTIDEIISRPNDTLV